VKSVALYTRKGCHLCDVVKAALDEEMQRTPFELTVVDIDTSASLKADYGMLIPVVFVDNVEIARFRIDRDKFRAALEAS
jgi:glutaredoxin